MALARRLYIGHRKRSGSPLTTHGRTMVSSPPRDAELLFLQTFSFSRKLCSKCIMSLIHQGEDWTLDPEYFQDIYLSRTHFRNADPYEARACHTQVYAGADIVRQTCPPQMIGEYQMLKFQVVTLKLMEIRLCGRMGSLTIL